MLQLIEDQLQRVSEWRIEDSTESEKEYGWNYRVSNGGVYCSVKDLDEAKRMVAKRIFEEKNFYLLEFKICANCSLRFSIHTGRDYEWCLKNLSSKGLQN